MEKYKKAYCNINKHNNPENLIIPKNGVSAMAVLSWMENCGTRNPIGLLYEYDEYYEIYLNYQYLYKDLMDFVNKKIEENERTTGTPK